MGDLKWYIIKTTVVNNNITLVSTIQSLNQP